MDVYIFGAGASAAEGLPATDQFFARAWELLSPDFDPPVRNVWRFLAGVFGVAVDRVDSFRFLPPVDEVISLVDWCLHVNQGLGGYDLPLLYQVRHDLEHLLCATLDAGLPDHPGGVGPHVRFVRALKQIGPGRPFALISLNYDTLLDDALLGEGSGVDYGFAQLGTEPMPLLAKLHGSLNWALCPACSGITVTRGHEAYLLPESNGLACGRCGGTRMRGLIISPTWQKRYQAFPLQQVWEAALGALQQADRVVFVGYSIPPADVAIYHLIRRALLIGRRPDEVRFEVINHHKQEAGRLERELHEASVLQRFGQLLGPRVSFDFSGFRGQV
ncbi:MAG: SIR2 family protein [Mycobacterium leprae]